MFIKHKMFMDVAIEVFSSQRKSSTELIVRGSYWNLGATASYPLNVYTKLTITEPDNWLQAISFDLSLRTANWEPLSI